MAYTYAPHTQNRTGEILAAGIDSAGSSIASAMEKSKEEKKQADYYRKLGGALGLDEGFVASASAKELKGAIDARAIKRTEEIYDESKQQQGAFKRAMGLAANPPGGGPTMPLPQAMLREGVTDPRYIQAGATMSDAMEPQFQPTFGTDKGTGVPFMTTSRKSAVPITDKALPAKSPKVLGFVPGPDGKKTGFAVVDLGDGKRRVVNTETKRTLTPLEQLLLLKNIAEPKSTKPGLFERMFGGSGPEVTLPATTQPTASSTGGPMIPVDGEEDPDGSAGTDVNDEFFKNYMDQ